jgi:hypothetical protein
MNRYLTLISHKQSTAIANIAVAALNSLSPHVDLRLYYICVAIVCQQLFLGGGEASPLEKWETGKESPGEKALPVYPLPITPTTGR